MGIRTKTLHHIHPVPVHIDGSHGNGQLLLDEGIHQILIFVLSIGIVAAPPVAQGILGNQGHLTGQGEEMLQAAAIIMAIGKEVKVRAAFSGQNRTILLQQQALAVVHHRNAGTGEDTLLQLGCAVDHIQGAGRAQQVALFKIGNNRTVRQGNAVHLPGSQINAELHLMGPNNKEIAFLYGFILHLSQITVPDSLGGQIGIVTGLQTKHAGGQNGNAQFVIFQYTVLSNRCARKRKSIHTGISLSYFSIFLSYCENIRM